jgi:hypothetical protein
MQEANPGRPVKPAWRLGPITNAAREIEIAWNKALAGGV